MSTCCAKDGNYAQYECSPSSVFRKVGIVLVHALDDHPVEIISSMDHQLYGLLWISTPMIHNMEKSVLHGAIDEKCSIISQRITISMAVFEAQASS